MRTSRALLTRALTPSSPGNRHDGPVERIRVEVFPVEPDRWIGVIEAPDGPFSTEVKHPRDVRADVQASAAGVLERDDLVFDLVDDLGRPWTPETANEQLQRLGVEYRAGRGNWFSRIVSRVLPFQGECPVCGHDWREHIPADGQCSECTYEIEHEDPGAPTVAFTLQPPVPQQHPG